MNTVLGRNAIIEMDVSGSFYPIFCCKSWEFVQNQEVIEVTTVNSPLSREYEPGMTTGTLNVSGVTIRNNTGGRISITYLIQESIRRAVQSMRIKLTDDDGGISYISFNAIITSNTLSRQFGSYSQSVTGFVITGVPVLSDIIPAPEACSETQEPLYIDCVAGESSVHDDLLEEAGVVILTVARTGVVYSEVPGTPGDFQFRFGGVGDGTINFSIANPFTAGEVIYVLYRK